jgi:hypothetical protein
MYELTRFGQEFTSIAAANLRIFGSFLERSHSPGKGASQEKGKSNPAKIAFVNPP